MLPAPRLRRGFTNSSIAESEPRFRPSRTVKSIGESEPRGRRSVATVNGESHHGKSDEDLDSAIASRLSEGEIASLDAFMMNNPPPIMDTVTERSYLAAACLTSLMCVGVVVECFVRLVLDPAFKRSEEELAAATGPSSLSAVAPLTASGLEPTWSGTESGPSYQLTSQEFAEMQCLLAWFTCVFTGLGSEFFMGYEMMLHVDKITSVHEHMWFVAQFLFPIMIYSAILLAKEHNAWALAFGTVGMWKFGFPETLSCFLRVQQPRGVIHFLTNLLNALGTLTHHSTSMLFICIFTTGLTPMTRPLIAGSTPLVVQHLFVSLKYLSMPVYAIAELLIEIFWEWEVFSALELFYVPHGVPLSGDNLHPTTSGLVVRCVSAMLLAHWFYWAAAIADAIGMALGSPGYETDAGSAGTMHSWHGGAVAGFQQDVNSYHQRRSEASNSFSTNEPTPTNEQRERARKENLVALASQLQESNRSDEKSADEKPDPDAELCNNFDVSYTFNL